MGLFDKIFTSSDKKNTPTVEIPWVQLTSTSQLDEAVEISNTKTVVLFKHSTRCSISSSALNRFQSKWTEDTEVVPFYLDLIAHRDISNQIAERFGVIHQSPQAVALKNGKAVYNASHMSINLDEIKGL